MPRVFSLSKREADLAIGLARPDKGRLHARKLTDYALGLFGNAEYLRAHPARRSRADLAAYRLIGYIDDLIYVPELDYLPLIAPHLRPGFTSSTLTAQLAATQAGQGLSVLPCFMATPERELQRVLAEDVALIRSFWLIVHADLRKLDRVAVAADFIPSATRAGRGRLLPGISSST